MLYLLVLVRFRTRLARENCHNPCWITISLIPFQSVSLLYFISAQTNYLEVASNTRRCNGLEGYRRPHLFIHDAVSPLEEHYAPIEYPTPRGPGMGHGCVLTQFQEQPFLFLLGIQLIQVCFQLAKASTLNRTQSYGEYAVTWISSDSQYSKILFCCEYKCIST